MTLSATGRARADGTRTAVEVRLRWRLPGDDRTADNRVWMTFDRDDRWAAPGAAPSGAADPTPLWWFAPVTVARDADATVLAAPGVDADAWLTRAADAAATVTRQLRGTVPGTPAADAGWDRRLVLEVPADQDGVERVVGAAAGTEGQLAAIAFADGSDAADAPVRVVVDPVVTRGQSAAGVRLLLVHETTHVATRSPASTLPLWLVEGFADFQAYTAVPEGRGPALGLLAEAQRSAGPPDGPPGDDRFGAQAADLDLSYAQAWSLCAFLAERGGSGGAGAARLDAFYARLDAASRPGADPATVLDATLRRTYGLDHDGFVDGWRAWLATNAR
ncbi:hypothetical protein FHX74_001964 [Friedmanniella endophytica]|uniref:Peptidase MA superfamily protein n=1 Tax=Microlunatus kandeliicorticis TaxID=1759536 RepID=A0A7W3ISC9_9ACTN|nr:hypothetical protein [Microlunatus kandeliicorticis]MBA8794345.1 hypothetical protein [Microlunatus kandeliicorticis]